MKPIAGHPAALRHEHDRRHPPRPDDQNYYVPLTGRWFRAKSLDGPWEFVDGDELPKDFAKIPENNPKANVLATVPGTPAAQEAVIANSIPQTAEVNREEAKFESHYDGDPQFEPVPDTSLQYAVNSPTPIVRVDPTTTTPCRAASGSRAARRSDRGSSRPRCRP